MSFKARHDAAIKPMLRILVDAAPSEEEQWVLLETLCLCVGTLHGRPSRAIATFVETMAETIVKEERT